MLNNRSNYDLCPTQVVDTLGTVPRQPRRSQTITPPGWWVREAGRRVDLLGLRQVDITRVVSGRAAQYDGSMGPLGKVDQSRVSRCLKGDPTSIGLLWLVSSSLGIPSPVIIPSRLSDARELGFVAAGLSTSVASQRELAAVEREFAELDAGVKKITNRRQQEVVSPRGGKVPKRSQS